jgi:hypothetical protein
VATADLTDPDDVYGEVARLAGDYPLHCKRFLASHKCSGWTPSFLQITSRAQTLAGGSPAHDPRRYGVLVIAGVHGNELRTAEAALAFADTLLDCALNDKGWSHAGAGLPGFSITNWELHKIMGQMDILVFPLVNPFGWQERKRTNKSGVDINRNFDIIWDFQSYYDPAALVRGNPDGRFTMPQVDTKKFDGSDHYRGSAAESEPETKNVAELLREFPITYFFDLHTDLGDYFQYPWGFEYNQTTARRLRYADWPFALQRKPDGKKGGYDEYVPSTSNDEMSAIAREMSRAVKAATGRTYAAQQDVEASQCTGSSDDYAFSLDVCNVRPFTLERAGFSAPGSPQATPMIEQWKRTYEAEMSVALFAALKWVVDRAAKTPPPKQRRHPVVDPKKQTPCSEMEPAGAGGGSVQPLKSIAPGGLPLPPSPGIPPGRMPLGKALKLVWAAWLKWLYPLLYPPVAPPGPTTGSPAASIPAPTLSVSLDPPAFHYVAISGQQIGEFTFSWRASGTPNARVSLQVMSQTYGWSPVPGFQNRPLVGSGTWNFLPRPGQTLWFRAVVSDGALSAFSQVHQFQ